MRKSKDQMNQEITDFIDVLSFHPKGLGLEEIIVKHHIINGDGTSRSIKWSRATVFRLLEKLGGNIIKEKVDSGCRGRPKFRYRIGPSLTRFSIYSPGLRYERCGSKVVRLTEEDKQFLGKLKRAENLSKAFKRHLI